MTARVNLTVTPFSICDDEAKICVEFPLENGMPRFFKVEGQDLRWERTSSIHHIYFPFLILELQNCINTRNICSIILQPNVLGMGLMEHSASLRAMCLTSTEVSLFEVKDAEDMHTWHPEGGEAALSQQESHRKFPTE